MFPLVAVVRYIFQRQFQAIGKYLRIDQNAVDGLLATLINNLPAIASLEDMDGRSRMVNTAFLVSASFALGDHLAYSSQTAPDIIAGGAVRRREVHGSQADRPVLGCDGGGNLHRPGDSERRAHHHPGRGHRQHRPGERAPDSGGSFLTHFGCSSPDCFPVPRQTCGRYPPPASAPRGRPAGRSVLPPPRRSDWRGGSCSAGGR